MRERVYSGQEVDSFLDLLHDKQHKRPEYITPYAMELQIMMGLRRGEVPPLRWSDVHEDKGYIEICREQLTVKRTKTVKEHFLIVEHTKTHKSRRFPLTPQIKDFLSRLKEMQDLCYPDCPYLFPADTDNGVITNNAVYNLYRRLMIKLGIEHKAGITKGTHSFRRNAITRVINSSGGNVLLASQLFGNSPEVAKANYYTGYDMDEALRALE